MQDHAYFFSGNCQMQYLAAMVGSVSTADRTFVGHRYNVNVALDGPQVDCVERRDFLKAASAARSQGKRTILVLQETSRSVFAHRLRKKRDLFDEYILFPHVHFGSQWPHRRLKVELDTLTDQRIKRVFEWEQHDFNEKLRRCELNDPKGFGDAYWERARNEARFYHPGHPTGELFADILDEMSGVIGDRLPCYADLSAALRRSHGIYQNCTHPALRRATDILGLKWAQSELYQAWFDLTEAADPATLAVAIDRAEAVLTTPELLGQVNAPFQAHFRVAHALAVIKSDGAANGLARLQDAIIDLKGYTPLLRKTLTLAARARRLDVVERMLVDTAPFVIINSDSHAGIETCLQNVMSLPSGRDILGRVRDRTLPETWIHRCVQNAMAA